jgi:hypothetical protein
MTTSYRYDFHPHAKSCQSQAVFEDELQVMGAVIAFRRPEEAPSRKT